MRGLVLRSDSVASDSNFRVHKLSNYFEDSSGKQCSMLSWKYRPLVTVFCNRNLTPFKAQRFCVILKYSVALGA